MLFVFCILKQRKQKKPYPGVADDVGLDGGDQLVSVVLTVQPALPVL